MAISSPQKAVVIGAGNLAWSLIPNLQHAGIRVIQLISRNVEKLQEFASEFQIERVSDDYASVDPGADWVFITVSDHAIAGVAQNLSPFHSSQSVYLHTSGSIDLKSLAPLGKRTGVLYPMQSFTRDKIMNLKSVPVFVEGEAGVMEEIDNLARMLSGQVVRLDSEDRLRLHLGAVLVNNFTNYLYRLAQNVNGDLPFELYRPLIEGHLEKVFAFGPENCQTGPAVRGDTVTVEEHLRMLKDQTDIQTLYKMISRLINPRLEI